MESFSDEKLYDQAVAGDQWAFKSLYDRYSGPLLRFIYRFTVNKERAEEIVHDIFTELLSEKFVSGPDSNLKSWLYMVAKNKSLNHLKRSSLETRIELPGDHSEADSRKLDHLNRLAVAETTLPQDLRHMWNLRKQGLNYEKIAAELSVPLGTVKSRFHRLVGHLKKEFENE